MWNVLFTTGNHIVYLYQPGLFFRSIVGIIMGSLLIIVAGFLLILGKHVAKAQPIESIRFLIFIAQVKHFLIERYGFIVSPEQEVAFGIAPIVKRTLMRGESRKLRNGFVEVLDGFGIVPFIIVTYTKIGQITWIERVLLVQAIQDEQCLMVFSRRKILDSTP